MAEYTLMYTIEVYFVTLGLTTFAHVLRLLHINCETASAEKCSMDLTKSTALQTLLYPVKPTWPPPAASDLLQLHIFARHTTCSRNVMIKMQCC